MKLNGITTGRRGDARIAKDRSTDWSRVMTERIDHYAAEAVKHIEWAHAQQGTDGEFEFTVRDNALIAQAEATLALVEQQRIANLIAAVEIEGGPYRLVNIWPDAWQKATEEIKEALGL